MLVWGRGQREERIAGYVGGGGIDVDVEVQTGFIHEAGFVAAVCKTEFVEWGVARGDGDSFVGEEVH